MSDQLSEEGRAILMAGVTRDAIMDFERAAELSSVVRYLHWYTETGDALRNGHKLSSDQLTQRKAILKIALNMLRIERDAALEGFFKRLNYRDSHAIMETLDGSVK